jgi:hypothetical protein
MTLVMLARAHDPDVLADVAGLVEVAVQCSYDPDRRSASRHLAARAGNRRRLLELHDIFDDRLLQKSSDFDATRGLLMTIHALRSAESATVGDSLGA